MQDEKIEFIDNIRTISEGVIKKVKNISSVKLIKGDDEATVDVGTLNYYCSSI